MKHILMILSACVLLGCASSEDGEKLYLLQGAWTLQQIDYPTGLSDTFPHNGRTFLRLYEADSTLYECGLTQTASAIIVVPDGKCNLTLIDKGGGEYLYLEDDNPRPLTVKDDTTVVIQQNGVLYTWHRADDIAKEWSTEIHDIIVADLQREGHSSDLRSYVLSAKERQQAGYINWLVGMLVGAAVFMSMIIKMYVSKRRLTRRLQQQLHQIQENHEQRPAPVKQMMESMEDEFFASDDYQTLQRRISTGQRLREEEWSDIEEQIKKVYPGFSSQLRSLHPMSELEYQTCLLIKLRIAPSDIASVLARDVSTISTVRSRLYKKVFGQKGGAKEWDEFLLSIGA